MYKLKFMQGELKGMNEMETCKYCGSNLEYIGELDSTHHFFCDYCDLSFEESDTCKNRLRKQSVPDHYDINFYKSTKELLNCNTVELFHLLRDCRQEWYSIFNLLSRMTNMNEHELELNPNIDEAFKPLYSEYVDLTKQKFIIENILLEKAGFLPDKLTDEFLSNLINQGKEASSKPMYIYIKKKNK